jgi:hypothetical protein
MVNDRVIVLSVEPMEFTDNETGKPVRGVQVFAVSVDAPMATDDRKMGLNISKSWCPFELKDKLTTAPAIYDLGYVIEQGRRGARLKVVDAKYVAPFHLLDAIELSLPSGKGILNGVAVK